MRLPELLALERVAPRGVECGLRDPDGLRRDPDPPAVEGRHRDDEALALLVEHAVAVDERAVETQVGRRGRVEPELLLLARHLHVLGVEQEGGDAARALGVRVGPREEQEGRRVAAVRAPLLRAADPPGAVAVRARPSSAASPRRTRIRAP